MSPNRVGSGVALPGRRAASAPGGPIEAVGMALPGRRRRRDPRCRWSAPALPSRSIGPIGANTKWGHSRITRGSLALQVRRARWPATVGSACRRRPTGTKRRRQGAMSPDRVGPSVSSPSAPVADGSAGSSPATIPPRSARRPPASGTGDDADRSPPTRAGDIVAAARPRRRRRLSASSRGPAGAAVRTRRHCAAACPSAGAPGCP